MMNAFSNLAFSSVGMFYGLVFLMAIVQLLCLILIPSMMRQGATAAGAAKAIYCYLAQSLGILLMSIAALPAIYGVLLRQSFSPQTYIGLLFMFAFGGFTFLWHDFMVRSVDPASRAVPYAVHFYLWKFVGFTLLLLGTLSLLLRLLFTDMWATSSAGWAINGTLILFGFALSWCTSHLPGERNFHQTTVMSTRTPVAPAVAASSKKKAVVKKKK